MTGGEGGALSAGASTFVGFFRFRELTWSWSFFKARYPRYVSESHYLQNHSIFLCTKLNNHLLSMDCSVVSQLKMVGYGCTTEGMHYATHFGRRNTKFFSVKSYNITQQSSTFDGNNKTMLFTTKKGQLRLYDRGTALRNAIWVS